MTGFSSSQLRTLKRASEGVERVTEQLEELIFNVADLISSLGKNRDSIRLGSCELEIIELEAYKDRGQYKHLVFTVAPYEEQANIQGYGDYYVVIDSRRSFVGRRVDETTQEYHEETNRFVRMKNRENIIFFAENIGRILQAFIELWQQQEEETEQLIDQFKANLAKFLQED